MVSFNAFNLGVPAMFNDAQFRSQQGAESIIGLANQVRPDMTPEELVAVHQQEKELVMQKIKDDINYEYNFARHEFNEKRRKDKVKQRERLLNMGVIFG